MEDEKDEGRRRRTPLSKKTLIKLTLFLIFYMMQCVK